LSSNRRMFLSASLNHIKTVGNMNAITHETTQSYHSARLLAGLPDLQGCSR
jgi:hypothetical protein